MNGEAQGGRRSGPDWVLGHTGCAPRIRGRLPGRAAELSGGRVPAEWAERTEEPPGWALPDRRVDGRGVLRGGFRTGERPSGPSLAGRFAQVGLVGFPSGTGTDTPVPGPG